MSKIEFHLKNNFFALKGKTKEISTIKLLLELTSIKNAKTTDFKLFESKHLELTNQDINHLFSSENFDTLKENGLLFL